jgi:predicted GIY-YIG superfamily endonuclease
LDYKQVVLLLSLLRNNPQIIKLKAKAIETASLAQVLELLATFETEGVPPGRYVYAFISESGKIKIGITTDVDRRFKELSAMSPERLTLAFYKPATSKGYADEVRLHKACAEYRLHNEWFAPEALSLVQSQLDPNPKC